MHYFAAATVASEMFSECCACPSEVQDNTLISYKVIGAAAYSPGESNPRREATETDDEISDVEKHGSCHEISSVMHRECYADTYSVLLQKTEECGILGLSTTASRVLPYGMRVRKVKAVGLVKQWNMDHPDRRVASGDIITEVNGISGSADRMCDVIAADQILALTVLKYIGNRTFSWRRTT